MAIGRPAGSKTVRPSREELAEAFEELGKAKHVAERYGVKLGTVYGWKQKYGLTQKRTGKSKFPNQRLEEIADEEWRPLLVGHKKTEVPGYVVSQYGNIIGPAGHKKLWSNQNGYPHVMISVPIGTFSYFSGIANARPDANSDDCNTELKNVAVHRAVADAFLPRPVPECFEDIWDTLTEEQKMWVQRVYVVDHIDNQKHNPHLDNLQYLTTHENSKAVKAKREQDNESS